MENKKNPMQEVKIEKMVLNCSGLDDKLDRSVKLLELITKRKIRINKSNKRIPTFGISPGKKSGCMVTIRNIDEITKLMKRFFAAVDNQIKERQITDNQFSMGIKEYIEILGLEYSRDIGMLGFEITIVFTRNGKRVKIRKAKRGKYPVRQKVTKEEIIDFIKNKFDVEVLR